MTSKNKTWENLKSQYLHHVAKALSSVKHPRKKDILDDVRSHLDRRFEELEPDQRTWENLQAIITDMGPASDYAELLQTAETPARQNITPKYLLWVGLVLVGAAAAMIILPMVFSNKEKVLEKVSDKDTGIKQTGYNAKEQAIKAALDSARVWLDIVDAGDYGRSWEQAAAHLKKAVSKDQFQESFEALRRPLGKVISREALSKTYTNQIPGGPDGEYIIIQFKVSFENKNSAIETITPMLDKNGTWRVSGYYIK